MKPKCTKLIFKARESNYFNEKTFSFEHKQSFTLLKRDSCKCSDCMFLMDHLIGEGREIMNDNYWDKTWNCTDFEPESKYRLIVTEWGEESDELNNYGIYPESFKMEKVNERQ